MKRIAIIILTCSLTASVLNAQVKTSYFVRNSTMNHNFNPAFAPDQGFVGIPLLSNINVGTRGNLGLSSLVYPLDNGKLGLFLHPDVSAETAMSGFSKNNTLGAGLQYDIIDAGWFTGKDTFWTLSLGLNAEMDFSVPYEFMEFMKVGMNENPASYSISGINMESDLYAQLALGYSRGLDNLVKGLRIGGKLKLVAPLVKAYATMERLDVRMSSEVWTVTSKAKGTLYGSGVDFVYDDQGHISGYSIDPYSMGLAGFGAALDLGVEYTLSEGTPVDGLRFALSVTDLGFVGYGKDKSTMIESEEDSFVFEGFENIGLDTDMSQQFNKLMEDILGLASFSETKIDKSCFEMTRTKLFASADYSFLRDKMNVGLLYSAKFGKLFDEHELTLAWNYAPVRWFDVALSYSMLNTGTTFGWLLTFVPRKGLNFFIGSDYTSFNYSSIGIPVHGSYLNVNLGISVPLGGKNRKY